MNRLQLPVAAAQSVWLRRTLTMAPPAAGPTRGTTGAGDRVPLAIAVLGESSAAGCGVDRHEDGFAGNLARELSARAGRPVDWQVVGQFGATARRIRYRLLPLLDHDLDVAVLLAGGNDVMSRRSAPEWRDDVAAIIDDLLERADHVVVAGTPPFVRFPAIPVTLGRYLAERGAALDGVTRALCADRPRTSWVTMTEVPTSEFFAADRFHLSAAGYRRWAQAVTEQLMG